MWKRAINSGLRRATGYQLQKVGRRGSGSAQAKEARKRRRRPRPKTGPRRDYDDAAMEIMRRVKPRTMTSNEKLYGLVQATRYVVQHAIPGDIVECGVWRGGSMQAVALTLLELGATDRHLHLFDTFEGMPPPTEKDRRFDGRSAEELLATQERDSTMWGIAGVDEVRQAMTEVDYPAELVHFHEGLVENTIPSQAPEQISILRLDTDWYESTRHELEHLYDRLSPGGVLIVDDYGHWAGARLATDDFLEKTGEALLLLPLSTGRIAVKPLR
jgi:O-methyltransferase